MPTSNHKLKEPTPALETMTRAVCEPSYPAPTGVEKATGAAAFVGEKAEQATQAVGAGMESLGGVIREHEPADGVLHNAGEAIAQKLVAAGRYLEDHGLKGVADDVTNLIRRNPIPALLIGIGVGVLLARIVRR
jgi:hypothetical protein